MIYFPHFVMSYNGYKLFQMGHYQYEIYHNGKTIKLIMDSCENAINILKSEFGE